MSKVFPVFGNSHSTHPWTSRFASPSFPRPTATQGRRDGRLASSISLQVVGLRRAELFVTRKGTLLVNELAPRPHNSGHLTLDANVTSQFEQQLRAVCSLPSALTALPQPWPTCWEMWLAAGGSVGRRRAVDPSSASIFVERRKPRRTKMGHPHRRGVTVEEAVRK